MDGLSLFLCDIMTNIMKKLSAAFLAVLLLASFLPLTGSAQSGVGASLFISPPSGTLTVGGTLTVSVILNTNNQSVNAVEANLSFPPDKLQVVSPMLGTSIVGVWTNQPQFDNQNGTLRFQGGMPNPGINTSRGVVATITFRVKSVGQAIIKFLDSSKILLNDGLATDVLTNTASGIYNLVLPPPAGPLIISETHPDQTTWYKTNTASLQWANNLPVEGYSYILSNEPIDIPDNISEGTKTQVVYKDLPDGVHFFHVKALRGGVWGETSHYALKVDATAPAKFPIEIAPSSRTTSRRPIINFNTTDGLSGLDHFEIKIISRSAVSSSPTGQGQTFFIETGSPYYPELDLGTYEILVRAYDKAGNIREIPQKLVITTPISRILGFQFIPRWLMVILGLLTLAALAFVANKVRIWHQKVHLMHIAGAINDPEISAKLKELQDKRSQYMKGIFVLLICFVTAFGFGSQRARAESLATPIITSISENISNEEIFYIGGKTIVPGGQVSVHIQNLHDGQTFSQIIDVDKKGDWFYSHPNFFAPGKYLIWVQGKNGQEVSAPSPQRDLSVAQTAIQFGSSRLSLETLYLVFVAILLLALTGLIAFVLYHGYHGKKKHKKITKEIIETEEAIKRGFLLLHKDLEAELRAIHKKKSFSQLSTADAEKELRLSKDLEWVSKFIEKEVKNIEKLLGSGR